MLPSLEHLLANRWKFSAVYPGGSEYGSNLRSDPSGREKASAKEITHKKKKEEGEVLFFVCSRACVPERGRGYREEAKETPARDEENKIDITDAGTI